MTELNAERVVVRSRWIGDMPVVHFKAEDWLWLRGLLKATPAQIAAASGRGENEPTAHPASHAKT